MIPSQKSYERSATLTGKDPMPWGKYKGTELRRVPQWYFKWFIAQGFREYWPALRDYAKQRLGLDELPKVLDRRPKGPAQPPTPWIVGENYHQVESEEAPF